MNLVAEPPLLVHASEMSRSLTSLPPILTTSLVDLAPPSSVPTIRRSKPPTVDLVTSFRSTVFMVKGGDAIWAASQDLAARASMGLLSHHPELLGDCEGGTYLLRDENGDPLGIFKPDDEEPFAIGNPKNRPGTPQPNTFTNAEVKKGIRPGEAAVREVAAYLLDHDHRARVPLTAMVQVTHPRFGDTPKTGSLQEFVESECQSWDLGPSMYAQDDVQMIGVLDIRLFNVDRHGGNILVQSGPRGGRPLVPIDHGFSLPDSPAAPDMWFEWMTWPQAKKPFSESILAYVKSIDPQRDARILKSLGIRQECISTMITSTTLLKKACERGMTLHDIGCLILRQDMESASLLEAAAEKTDTRPAHFHSSVAEAITNTLDTLDTKNIQTPPRRNFPMRTNSMMRLDVSAPSPLRNLPAFMRRNASFESFWFVPPPPVT